MRTSSIDRKRTYYFYIVFMIINWNLLRERIKIRYLKIEFIRYQITNSSKSKNI